MSLTLGGSAARRFGRVASSPQKPDKTPPPVASLQSKSSRFRIQGRALLQSPRQMISRPGVVRHRAMHLKIVALALICVVLRQPSARRWMPGPVEEQ